MTGYDSKRAAAQDKLAQEPPQYSFKTYWAEDGRIGVVGCIIRPDGGPHIVEEFIDPPQRPWVGLTDEEVLQIRENLQVVEGISLLENLTKAIEAKLKEKNNAA